MYAGNACSSKMPTHHVSGESRMCTGSVEGKRGMRIKKTPMSGRLFVAPAAGDVLASATIQGLAPLQRRASSHAATSAGRVRSS
jgi:hypothetical protein